MSNLTLFILNDAPYGNERAYNALRMAAALAGLEGCLHWCWFPRGTQVNAPAPKCHSVTTF